MRIDSHLHLWPSTEGYRWLTDDLAPINRGFAPAEAHEALIEARFDSAVLVQAADTDADTDWLLTMAQTHEWVAGVVGWVPLSDASQAERRLEELSGRPLVGIRGLINDQPDHALLDRPEVRQTLTVLADRNLPFDIHDAWPWHLDAATRAASEIDGLTMVLDHLGKIPGDDADELRLWRAAVERFAAVPHTIAKLSGLHQRGVRLSRATFEFVWDTALTAFGPQRLMLGSDWPMPLLADGPDATSTQLDNALHTLSGVERAHLEAGTARRIYRLDT
ncbi:MAG: hydrolase [Leifsonia sp.]|nr:hydrolase [Leifsonia sp.]